MKKLTPHHGFFALFFILNFNVLFAQVGINESNPLTTLDVNGAISLREGTQLTMGATNTDVSLGTTPYSVYRIVGPSTAFTISSIVPVTGADGQMVVLENTTTHAMTILHNSGVTAANQIFVAGGRNLVLSGQYATVTLVYNATHTRWIVTNYADNRYGDNIQSIVGTTDISVDTSTFTDMTDMSITFTPNHSVVYVTFGASGNMALAFSTPVGAYGHYRLVNVTASNRVEAATATLTTDFDFDDLAGVRIGVAWNASINMFPVSVTPGIPNTLKIQWRRDGLFTSALQNWVATLPEGSHRNMTIFD